ncbi:DNA/RNA endonuclease G, NUC1 [Burkholderia sp. CF099]|nr:DNA/RNA endonuclease G, NUC1 [Burkholderia sp. CF099]
MDKRAIDEIQARIAATAPERLRVRKLVAEGRWRDAEPDLERAQAYSARRRRSDRNGRESIIGDTEDFQRVSFLPVGAQRARAVAYVEVNYATTSELGTGFLISRELFITNSHVIKNEEAARGAQIIFDREMDENGRPRATTSFTLDPDRFALFSPEDELDYAVIAIGSRQAGKATTDDLGFCPLSNRPDKHRLGMNCNIVEHPNGLPKMIALRNNLLTGRTDRTLLYETDTDQGASGSAVFNDDWELVALHHWGQPHNDVDALPHGTSLNVNEGIRISSIYEDLRTHLATLVGEKRQLLSIALRFNESPQSTGTTPTLSAPHSASEEESLSIPFRIEEKLMSSPAQSSTIKFTIPFEISIRIPGLGAGSATAQTVDSLAPVRELTRGPEAIQIDVDYTNRTGFMADFIPGMTIPLPAATGSLAKQIASLRADEPDSASGELKYEHFSIKLNRARRMAIFTATNIDGQHYLDVDRATGKVNSSEGDVWFKDPRVSTSFFLDQTFYSQWSTYFDRGHLTRRSDPTWGTPAEAERANADTFHFSNCSPQHFRFNQSAVYWQGLERYVLENGVLANETKRRLCVIQGPIFDDKVDLWADDVQIPSSFFKIVVWKSPTGPKAVGLVADQLNLLSEARHSLGAPHDLQQVDVNHWRVSVANIETKTGLDFSSVVRNADTIGQAGQPNVGEARVLIKNFSAIKL